MISVAERGVYFLVKNKYVCLSCSFHPVCVTSLLWAEMPSVSVWETSPGLNVKQDINCLELLYQGPTPARGQGTRFNLCHQPLLKPRCTHPCAWSCWLDQLQIWLIALSLSSGHWAVSDLLLSPALLFFILQDCAFSVKMPMWWAPRAPGSFSSYSSPILAALNTWHNGMPTLTRLFKWLYSSFRNLFTVQSKIKLLDSISG